MTTETKGKTIDGVKPQRSLFVDCLRGIAVLAVLVAHANQRSLSPEILYPSNWISKLIMPWYMSLFVLLSGYCFKSYTFGSIGKKAKRLLIPTFVISILLWCVHSFEFVGIKWYFNFDQYSFLKYILMLFTHPTYVIWFLWVIFVYTLVLWLSEYLVQRFNNRNTNHVYVICISILFFVLLSNLNINGILGVKHIATYWIFFLVGYGLKHIKLEHMTGCVACLTGLGIVIKILDYTHIITLTSNDLKGWICIGVLVLLVKGLLCLKNKPVFKQIIDGLSWFGRKSLPFYLFQLFFLNIGIGTGALRFVSILLSAMVLTVLTTILVERIKPLSVVLLGDF